jgi:hypothetical protein
MCEKMKTVTCNQRTKNHMLEVIDNNFFVSCWGFLFVCLFVCFICFVLGVESRASHMLGKSSTTEINPQS